MRTRIFPGFALMAVLSIFAAPALATIDCPADHQSRINNLADFLARIDRTSTDFGDMGIESVEGLHANTTDLLSHLSQFGPEQSQQLCDSIASVPELAAIPENLEIILAQTQGLGMRAAGCVALPESAWNALFITAQSLQQASIVAGGVCGATECFPLVCSVPCIFKGIADSAAIVAQAALDRADYCGTIGLDESLNGFAADSKAALDLSDARLDVVVPRVDGALSSRANQIQVDVARSRTTDGFSSLREVIEGIRRTSQAQAAQQQESSDNMRRQLIESSLQDPGDGAPVTLFLPASRGGLLETVREQIAATINTYRSLGVDVTAANALFAAGDAALNVQDYKQAYSSYRDAYRNVTTSSVAGGINR
jgi:hypothetical protein